MAIDLTFTLKREQDLCQVNAPILMTDIQIKGESTKDGFVISSWKWFEFSRNIQRLGRYQVHFVSGWCPANWQVLDEKHLVSALKIESLEFTVTIWKGLLLTCPFFPNATLATSSIFRILPWQYFLLFMTRNPPCVEAANTKIKTKDETAYPPCWKANGRDRRPPPIIVDTSVKIDEKMVPVRSWPSLRVLSPRDRGVLVRRGSSSDVTLSSESNEDAREETSDIGRFLWWDKTKI